MRFPAIRRLTVLRRAAYVPGITRRYQVPGYVIKSLIDQHLMNGTGYEVKSLIDQRLVNSTSSLTIKSVLHRTKYE